MWLKALARAARSAKWALSSRVSRLPPAIASAARVGLLERPQGAGGRPGSEDRPGDSSDESADQEPHQQRVQSSDEVRQVEYLEIGGLDRVAAFLSGNWHAHDELGGALDRDELLGGRLAEQDAVLEQRRELTGRERGGRRVPAVWRCRPATRCSARSRASKGAAECVVLEPELRPQQHGVGEGLVPHRGQLLVDDRVAHGEVADSRQGAGEGEGPEGEGRRDPGP